MQRTSPSDFARFRAGFDRRCGSGERYAGRYGGTSATDGASSAATDTAARMGREESLRKRTRPLGGVANSSTAIDWALNEMNSAQKDYSGLCDHFRWQGLRIRTVVSPQQQRTGLRRPVSVRMVCSCWGARVLDWWAHWCRSRCHFSRRRHDRFHGTFCVPVRLMLFPLSIWNARWATFNTRAGPIRISTVSGSNLLVLMREVECTHQLCCA